MTHLVRFSVVEGPLKGRSYEFEQDEMLIIGRDDACQISIPDSYLSQFHARVEICPTRCQLVDLDSRNGTILNGIKTARSELKNGDVISLGSTQIAIGITESEKPQNLETTLDLPPKDPGDETLDIGNTKPTPVHGYQIERELGRGSMGIVYLAYRSADPDSKVALKVIQSGNEKVDDLAAKLFEREIGVLRQLDHPRITKFIDANISNDVLFVAMEYIPTINFMKEIQPVSWPQKLRLITGSICHALAAIDYAHRQDVVHRDIKPSNLLFYRSNKNVGVKVSDFGLAKKYVDSAVSTLTQDGEIRGTMAFMPPEQIRDSKNVDPKCDIYSMAATLYYFLSATSPFEQADGSIEMSRILNDKHIDIRDKEPRVSDELSELIHRGLNRDPRKRFSSAMHFRELLIPFTKKQIENG